MTTTCKCGADIDWKGPGVYRCVWCGRTWMVTVEETPDSHEDFQWNAIKDADKSPLQALRFLAVGPGAVEAVLVESEVEMKPVCDMCRFCKMPRVRVWASERFCSIHRASINYYDEACGKFREKR